MTIKERSLADLMIGAYEWLMRQAIRNSRNPRPSSEPFLSGDTWRARADHIFEDSSRPFDPATVAQGDVIFVITDLVETFFQTLHPKISGRYTLLTHNADLELTAELARAADDKIIVWYAQNLTVTHPRIKPLPIGLENLHYYHNGIVADFIRLRQRRPEKHSRVLAAFNVATYPQERQRVLEILAAYPLADRVWGLNSYAYRRRLQTYQFVASPRGNGLDCHRTWEALYLGVIPIVITSALDSLYANYPIWILNGWQELYEYDEERLRRKYAEIMGRGHNYAMLRADYFWQVIRNGG